VHFRTAQRAAIGQICPTGRPAFFLSAGFLSSPVTFVAPRDDGCGYCCWLGHDDDEDDDYGHSSRQRYWRGAGVGR
jgi:hypothetical protein